MRARLPELFFAVPGGVDLPTGGATYDRRLAEGLRALGWRVELLAWPGSFPFPSDADRRAVASSLGALPDGALVLVDGLALGTLPDLARAEAERLRLVALVHHPLAMETGLPPATASRFAAEERAALSRVRAVIVTSHSTAATLVADYGAASERITVAPPGLEPRPDRTPRLGPPLILSLGHITPRKAHHILVEALSRTADLDFDCIIVGDTTRDPSTAAALAARIADCGLAGRVTLAGAVSDAESARLHAQAEIFALASLHEGYGMALADAMAWGLPIVATTGGAIPEVVPPDAGLLVPPGDVGALAGALRSLLTDPARRTALAAAGRTAAARIGGWDRTAATVAPALERL